MKTSEAKVKFSADVKEYKEAVKQANSTTTELRAETNLLDTQMKNNGKSVEALEQKKKLLAKQLEVSQDKVDALNGELELATKYYGENSAEVTKLKTQLANAQTAQEKIKIAIKSCNDEIEQQEKGFGDAGNAIEKASDKVETASEGFTVMKGVVSDLAADGIESLIGGCGDLISSFSDLSEETREYREDISKLKTAWESAGKSTELATKVYKDFYSVLGEEDRSIEAINHLAKFVDTEENMAKWTEICTGVWGTFGDSLPIEGLTEASNETTKTGQVTGVLADALNWAAKEGETFGVKLKENTEANEEWNKAVQACTKAEDYFNLALQECTTEQERQALICETLNDLYSDASKKYKENNKNIIASRKATSEYNDVLAKMGEELEPVNTKVTQLKTTFLKELTPTLKKQVVPAFENFVEELDDSGAIEDFTELIGDLSEDVLPVTVDILGFATKNFKELAVGIGVTFVAFQTLSIISTVTVAIKEATTAMGALNAVMSGNVLGAVLSVVGIVGVGMTVLSQSTDEATESFTALSEVEQELVLQNQETAESLREMQTSIDEKNGATKAEMDYAKTLATELIMLADSNGKVTEANRTRAQFILNELNDALDTEYTMVDGIIQNYANLQQSIYDVINAKTANAMLETKNEAYILAIQSEDEALKAVNNTYKDYEAQLAIATQAEQDYIAKNKEFVKASYDEKTKMDLEYLASLEESMEKSKTKWEKENALLEEKKTAYNDATNHYANCQNTITEYENAAMLIQEGNYEKAIKLLKNKSGAYFEYSSNVSEATQEAIDALYEEMVQAGIYAADTKQGFINGVKGFTIDMVEEAEQGYKDALDKWANAYMDANSIGKDLSNGLADGMESKKTSLISKARTIVSGIISAMRKEADSHSPSRKTIDFGEDMGEGTEIGLINKTDDVIGAAKEQVGGIMQAYSTGFANPIIPGGVFGEMPFQRNITTAVEHNINNSGFSSIVSAINELASRPVVIKINDRTIAETTASANDNVNGLRNTFRSRGLILD